MKKTIKSYKEATENLEKFNEVMEELDLKQGKWDFTKSEECQRYAYLQDMKDYYSEKSFFEREIVKKTSKTALQEIKKFLENLPLPDYDDSRKAYKIVEEEINKINKVFEGKE